MRMLHRSNLLTSPEMQLTATRPVRAAMSNLGPYEAPLTHEMGCLAGCLLAPVLGCLGIVALVLWTLALIPPAPCESTRREVPSPEGRFTAVIERRFCDAGATGSSVILDVRLAEGSDSQLKPNSVLLVGMRRSGSDVLVSWLDPTTLLVNYNPQGYPPYGQDTGSLYHVGPAEWRGVSIVYRGPRP
jgi:hypothetical protein